MDGIDKDTFKQIFIDHWDAFKGAYPRYDTADYSNVVEKMLACGDPEKMGFAQYRCMQCGDTRRIPFTCKSTFCLSCAKVYTDQWTDFIGRRLFPNVTYRHVVLTVPDFLHKWFYRHPHLLSSFMRIGHACLKDIFHAATGKQLDLGTVIVLQTDGRAGNYNPHLHILVTAGGLDDKKQWNSLSYIPYELMHKKWQFHLLKWLREQLDDLALDNDIDHAWKKYPKGFVAYLQPGKVPPGGKGLARYLAKYLVSPPISLRRIQQYDGQTVSYWYRDHKTEQIQHLTLPVLTFIGRMVQHILTKGFQRIRYYGLHSHVRYQPMRLLLAQLVPTNLPPDPRGYRVLPRSTFAQRFQKCFGHDPLRCPRCDHIMDLELIRHPKYGIIRDFGLFDGEELTPQSPELSLNQQATGMASRTPNRDAVGPSRILDQLLLPFM